MIPEDLMRKYKYGYVHSCEMLNEPFVKDLLKENQNLKKQQKEFIEDLEAEIKGYEAISDLLFSHNKELKVYKEILSKYKEIIGSDKE